MAFYQEWLPKTAALFWVVVGLKVESVLLQLSVPNKEIRKTFLKRRSDYLKTYKGFSVRKGLLTLYSRSNDLKSHRLGFTAPKAIGPAVIRNRYKRWCREIYRKATLENLKKPLDFNVFIGSKKLKKEDFKNAKFQDFEDQLSSALKITIKNFK